MFNEGFEKVALDWNSVKNLGTKTLDVLNKHRTAIGATAAAGAATGAIGGALKKDETGQRGGIGGAVKGAIGGGITGAALGAAPGLGKAYDASKRVNKIKNAVVAPAATA